MNDKVFVKESYKILEGTAVFKDGSVDEVKNVYVYSKINIDPWVEELEAENERLKRELKQTEVQDQVVIDRLRDENRKTLHALWMARTERAFAERRRYCAKAAFNDIENDALRIKWFEIQWKCREKAKEFE